MDTAISFFWQGNVIEPFVVVVDRRIPLAYRFVLKTKKEIRYGDTNFDCSYWLQKPIANAWFPITQQQLDDFLVDGIIPQKLETVVIDSITEQMEATIQHKFEAMKSVLKNKDNWDEIL